jgi:hypothetical protein
MVIECMYLAIHVTEKEEQVIIFPSVRSKTFTVIGDFTVFVTYTTRITTMFPTASFVSCSTTSIVCSTSILLDIPVGNFICESLNTWRDLHYIMPVSACLHFQRFSPDVSTVPVPCHCMQLHKELVDGFYRSQVPAWASILMSPKLGDTRLQNYTWQIYIQTDVAQPQFSYVYDHLSLQCNIFLTKYVPCNMESNSRCMQKCL